VYIVNSEYYEEVMNRFIGHVYTVDLALGLKPIFDPSRFSSNDINASDQL